MAAPTYIGKSTAAAGDIDFSASGRQAGDKLYVAIVTANQAITTPSGFSQVASSPQSRGTAGAIGGIRLGLFEKLSDGTETTVTITNPGDHVYAVGIVVRPAAGSIVETDVTAGLASGTATTSHVGNALSSTVADCLVVDFWGTDRDSAGPSYSAEANADLTNLTERHDGGTATGVGSGIVIYTGEKAAAGSIAATAATSAASVNYCAITLALRNLSASSGSTRQWLTLAGLVDETGARQWNAVGVQLGEALVTAYSLACDAGAFTLAGAAVGLRAARRIDAAAGSFALTGTAAGLKKGYALSAAAAGFALTGAAVALKKGYALSASAGAFALTGSALGFLRGLRLSADAGAFAMAGAAAGLAKGTRMAAAAGGFTVSGGAVTFIFGRTFAAEAGTFALNGSEVALRVARRLTAEAGAFELTGGDARLTLPPRRPTRSRGPRVSHARRMPQLATSRRPAQLAGG